MRDEIFLENLYLEHIDENIRKFPQSFLDADEIKILKKLDEMALLHCVRNLSPKSETWATISLFVDYFKLVPEPRNPRILWAFLIALFLFSDETCFSELEKEILRKLIWRICLYLNGLKDCPPMLSEEKQQVDLSFEKNIDEMKLYKAGFDLQDAKLEEILNTLDDSRSKERFYLMRNVYREGKKLLQNRENAELLFLLKNRTEKDPNHNEYFATGCHTDSVHRNSAIQRGLVKADGIKSSNPEYLENENVVFHSHPSRSPLSVNGIVDGDLGHSVQSGEQVFGINSDGDIFYTTPELAGQCFASTDRCSSYNGQVFLGNIKDFLQ